VTGALVHRVTFNGKRATGIVLSRGGRVEIVDAAREVILAAGAIGSPHLLQLSGVGAPRIWPRPASRCTIRWPGRTTISRIITSRACRPRCAASRR
jgi:choline dehydrogenase-like flavoprotein